LDDERFEYREKEAEEPIAFVETYIRHSKGEQYAGKPFKLSEWQKCIIRELFGWYYTGTDKRQYREAYIQLARKNGKTTLIAALAIYKFFKDLKYGAEIVVAASTEKQATICFDIAKSAILQSDHLAKRVTCKIKSFEAWHNNIPSVCKVVASDADSLEGMNVSLGIIDELHVHPDASMYRVIKNSQTSRLNPLLLAITTPGNDKTSFCYEQYEFSKKVIQGIIKHENFLPIIFEPDNADNWKDPKTWGQGNPNLNVSVTIDGMLDIFNLAQHNPTLTNDFKQYQLGLWVDQATTWLDVDFWDKGNRSEMPLELISKSTCYMGLDIASTDDLTSIALVWPNVNGKCWVKHFNFLPEDSINQKHKNVSYLLSNAKGKGQLITTPGNVIDYDFLREFIVKLCKQYRIKEIAADPYNATQLLTELQDKHGLTVVATHQGTHVQNPAIQHMETLLLKKDLFHETNELVRWQFSNISIFEDGVGRRRLDKDSRQRKIDAIAAMSNAFTRVVVNLQKDVDPFANGLRTIGKQRTDNN
jgi:phage terminase large subunit-like protein